MYFLHYITKEVLKVRLKENVLYDSSNNIAVKTFHSKVLPEIRAYNEHHHTECEISIFLSGRGIYAANGEKYSFCPGDMFLFGSNEAHCITEIYEELNLLNIHFNPRILWENPDNIELLSLFSARSKNFCNKISNTDEALKSIILNIEKEITEKKVAYPVQIRYLLFAALTHILREYDYTHTDTSFVKSLSATQKLKEAMQYIDANLTEKLTLQEIADVACMTPTYFSSLFKKFNGLSPWDYITIKRVEMAIEMLKTTDMTKLEIANCCGFPSSSNFYKLFFKITGKNPNDYTKQTKTSTHR